MSPETSVFSNPITPETAQHDSASLAPEQRSASNWRHRVGRIATRAALAVGIAFGGVATVEAVHPEQAQAANDYGDYLTGQYADQTKCAADARTLGDPMKIVDNGWGISLEAAGAGTQSNTSNGEVGTLELRTSDNCGTVWAKLNTNRPNSIQSVGVMHDGNNYRQARTISHLNFVNIFNTPSGISTSPMVYARGYNTRAYIIENGSEFGTYWAERN